MRLRNLEAELKRAGVSVVEASEAMGWGKNTLYGYIRCETDIPSQRAMALKRKFLPDCDFEQLFEAVD
jgi:hypothetical protein